MIQLYEFDSRHTYLDNGKLEVLAIDQDAGNIPRPVGKIAAEDHCTGWVWINDLFVVEDMRRQGIARKLVLAAMRGSEEFAVAGWNAGVHSRNIASIALFESLGFRWVYSFPENADVRVYSATQRRPDDE